MNGEQTRVVATGMNFRQVVRAYNGNELRRWTYHTGTVTVSTAPVTVGMAI